MSNAFVSIIMGSDSDLPLLENTMAILKGFGIRYEARVASAHRTPDVVSSYVADAEKRGCAVFIGAAGLAAHLAGAIAARTTRPVSGIDALYSTVQMPGGIPVATVAVGKAGAKNAAYLAAQILALTDPEIDAKVKADRKAASEEVMKKDLKLQEKLVNI